MERIRQPTKKERKALRKLAALAYERQLSEALSALGAGFDEWHCGAIDPWQLNDLIHRFHDGASRDLWKKYNRMSPEEIVGIAVAEGILELHDVPEAVRSYVADWTNRIRMFKEAP